MQNNEPKTISMSDFLLHLRKTLDSAYALVEDVIVNTMKNIEAAKGETKDGKPAANK